MKNSLFIRIALGVLIAVLALSAINRIFSLGQLFSGWGVSGENISIHTVTDSHVYFKPVCPDCGHISGMYSVTLSDGEDHSTIHQCEECWQVYDIEIRR